jgi:ABC-type antimicrobial peptide transport system permease subunit
MLLGMVATNVAPLLMLVVAIGTAAMLAACVPALRASRIDPMAALRES